MSKSSANGKFEEVARQITLVGYPRNAFYVRKYFDLGDGDIAIYTIIVAKPNMMFYIKVTNHSTRVNGFNDDRTDILPVTQLRGNDLIMWVIDELSAR